MWDFFKLKINMIISISGKIGSGKDTVAKIIQYLTTLNKFPQKFSPEDTFESLLTYWEDGNDEHSLSQWKDGGWEIKKFAYKLKQIVSLLTGIPVKDLEKQEVKDSYLGEEWLDVNYKTLKVDKETNFKNKSTVRELLQTLGTEALRDIIHPNIHVNALFADYKSLYTGGVDPYMDLGMSNEQREKIKVDITPIYPNWLISDLRFENEAQSVKDRNGLLIRVERNPFEDKSTVNNIEKYIHPSETALDNYKQWDYIINNDGTIEELVEKVRQILIEENILKNESIKEE